MIVLTLVGTSSLLAQFTPGNSSLDIPADGRSTAMGESFVALRGNSSAMLFNPAGLASLRGVHVAYGHRGNDWMSVLNSQHQNFSMAAETPFFSVGVFYKRLDLESEFRDEFGDIELFKLGNRSYGVSLAHSLADCFDIGATFKTFNWSFDFASVESNSPFLFDIGLLHTFDLSEQGILNSALSLGVALQNFGEDLKTPPEALAGGYRHVLPRALRTGFSYSYEPAQPSEMDLAPFGILITGEYRAILGDRYEYYRDFWGFGGEVVIFEIVSGRIGGFVSPWNGLYGKRGEVALRYGVGLSLPFQKLGIKTPLTLRADYSAIPLPKDFGLDDEPPLNTFSFVLSYNEDLF